MKNLKFIWLVGIVGCCFSAYAEDGITEHIKKYQVKKLQDLASQDLVMRAADKQKYLDQLQDMKQQLVKVKDDIKSGRRATCPETMMSFVNRPMPILKSFSYLVAGIFSLATAGAAAETIPANDPAKILCPSFLGLTSILFFYQSICGMCKSFYIPYLAHRLYRKVITMEAFIKSIPAVDEIVTQQ